MSFDCVGGGRNYNRDKYALRAMGNLEDGGGMEFAGRYKHRTSSGKCR